jgi:uncharacterized membrane protein (DUF2068 family)
MAVLAFIGAGFCVLGALVFFVGGAALAKMGGSMSGGLMGALGAFAGIFLLIVGVIYAVIGFGLWKLMNWARILSIVLVALGLLSGVYSASHLFSPLQVGMLIWQVIWIAIDVWIILYLLKPHVKQAFGAA